MNMLAFRHAEHDINPFFPERWSPRGYKQTQIDRDTLWSFFEAARWSPSAYNAQPWRFIYVLKGTAHWDSLFKTLSPDNQLWAAHTSALVLVVSKKTFTPLGKDKAVDIPSHSFDTGAACAHLTLQASLKGWHTRAIGGYDHALVRESLSIPDDYHLEVIIAIGQQGSIDHLPASLQAREQPTLRRSTVTFVAEGAFLFQD